ncbi:hypothetical protein [Parendozoicomonas sp. Alg238-R29]|uniref:hypothetical protein n=1 Tax=Parendozoicomonas sp. Alg238-R29 TaxID=2993446 RepID=UPI00248DF469|nr:hypothetical protein [Parendozoicomonas sp. Alg238-R29]
MKNAAVARWVELKKNTRHFETIMQSRRILNYANVQGVNKWDDMSSFFREADKYIK